MHLHQQLSQVVTASNMKKFHAGFTVLEILIVLAIMSILMSLILVGLNSARSHSQDQNKVTAVQTIVVGLTQYYDACRSYPATLDATNPATCSNLGGKTIIDFIPDLASYNFNQTGSSYMYTGLTTGQSNSTDCSNFHIGVNLAGSSSEFDSSKSSFSLAVYNSDPTNINRQLSVCGGSSDPIDVTQPSVFDIEK